MYDYEINTEYLRVLPRDLFNEAKLLKCIGRLVLLIHDGKRLSGMRFTHDNKPFKIGQITADGALTLTNITFTINKHQLFFKTAYNSKSNYPLYCDHNYIEYEVFDEEGNYTHEFTELCEKIATAQ